MRFSILPGILLTLLLSGCGGSDDDTSNLFTSNNKPIAQAGADQTLSLNDTIQMDGSTSYDEDGDNLSYQWSVTAKPFDSETSLSSNTHAQPTLTVNQAGIYTLGLIVNDGKDNSDMDFVVVTVNQAPDPDPDPSESANQAPVANAGDDKNANIAEAVSLYGYDSYDPDENTTLTYLWNMLSKPENSTAELSHSDQVEAQFTPDLVGSYEINLTVSDGELQHSDTIVISVGNTAPQAHAGTDQAVYIHTTVTLDGGQSSDEDNHTLSYRWSFKSLPEGSAASLNDSSIAKPSFVADKEGEYLIALVVNDGYSDSAEAVSRITANRNINRLAYRVIDAEYSSGMERIIMVSETPDQLHIYNPADFSETAVDLPLPPSSVSVGPSGKYAAVGHNAWVSYVNLETATLEKTIAVTTNVLDVILAGNGYIYAFPKTDQWGNIRSLEIATGTETLHTGSPIFAGTLAKLHPDGTSIYGADNGLSPSDLEKYDIQGGTAAYLRDSPYHGDYPVCGDLWISQDGLRIFTACGNVFRASSNESSDMTYNGSLDQLSQVRHLSHVNASEKILAIPHKQEYDNDDVAQDTELQIYDYDFLAFSERRQLPYFLLGDKSHSGHGRFVFADSKGEHYYVILQAHENSGLLNDYGIVRYDLDVE